jgi:proteasome alpha subunit
MEMPTEMQHQAMGYDRAATMFSPDGHLLQVEYAEKTVKLGSNSIGLVCKDGVLMISDRRIRDKLIAPESANKVFEVDGHIMVTAAGILSDARVLIDKAQIISQQNRVTYDAPIDPVSIIRMIADSMQFSTQYGGTRPFGTVILLGGVSKGKSHLYTTDVTGGYLAYRADAIGENDEQIKEILRKDFKDDMTIDDGIKFCLDIFKEILGKNFSMDRFDVGYITLKDSELIRKHGDELKKYLK